MAAFLYTNYLKNVIGLLDPTIFVGNTNLFYTEKYAFSVKKELTNISGLRPATLLKKRLWHKCFPVNFAKFLRTPFLTEHFQWLLLQITNIPFQLPYLTFNNHKKKLDESIKFLGVLLGEERASRVY